MAIKAFEIDYGANGPTAVAKIVDHADVLLEFYRYPAERWIHLHHEPDRMRFRQLTQVRGDRLTAGYLTLVGSHGNGADGASVTDNNQEDAR